MNRLHLLPLLLLLAPTAVAQWNERFPLTVPPNRTEAMMVFDMARGQTILFGGGGVGAPLTLRNDTWTWNGSDWLQLSPATSPSGRFGTTMAFDIARSRVVLYGGLGSLISIARPLADTWEWDGTTWTQITTATTPPGLAYHGFCYDLIRSRCVLFGGSSNPGLLVDSNQTWEYDGVNWTQRTPTTNPGPLERPAMYFHTAIGRTVLFSGINVQSGGTDITWTWDGTAWAQVPVTSARPPARTFAKMAYDTFRNVGVLQGGMDPVNGTPFLDTWQFDGTAWQLINTPGPSARTRMAMSFDQGLARIVQFGGVTQSFQPLTDTHEFGASYVPLGDGCFGTNGTPLLASTSAPRLGTTFAATMTNLAIGAPLGAVIAGLSTTTSALGALPLPMAAFGMPGCTLRVSADVTLFLPAIGGVVTSSIFVPNNLALLGVQMHQQGVSLDPAANAAGAVLSNAMTLTVGI